MLVYRYSEDEEIFNEAEDDDDFLDDCEFAYEEFDNYKAEQNLKGHRFRYVPESEGIGE